MTLVALACGLVSASAFGMVAGPLVLIVGVRTLIVLKRRREKGIATSGIAQLGLFVCSLVRTTLLTTLYLFAGLVFVMSVVLVYIFCVAGNVNFIAQNVVHASLLACIWFFAAIFSGIEKRFHYDTSRH
jgi:hypothetical protein